MAKGGTMGRARWLVLALALGGCAELAEPAATTPAATSDESRHEGYYYPRVSSSEVYKARARPLTDSDKDRRLGFVAIMLSGQLDQPYPPQHVLYAKGDQAEKMIIVGLSERFETLYRARAVLAGLTVLARQSPLFQDFEVDDLFTFFDLAKLLGFKDIVLSDGKTWAHRITLE
jgi:hypothetical protein